MEVFKFLKENIQKDNRAMLLLVVQSKGSSPGRQGFKMAVAMNNDICGSIGGGIMEYRLVEEAKVLLRKKSFEPFLKKQIHKGEVTNGSGMICSGEQVILFKILDRSDLQTIDEVLTHKQGILKIKPAAFEFHQDAIENRKFVFTAEKEGWTYAEKISKKNQLFIIGAGHVGLATSEIFSKLDFEITLIDDRKNLNTLASNNYSDKVIITDYHEIDAYIPENENTFIAIMTNGYQTDKIALEKVIDKKVGYIGVLGSKTKLKAMYTVLEKQGVSKNQLKNIHAPIGLSIQSQTPAEIAISIAAEIIAVKNKTELKY
ncbi:MAG: XdhC family protein [Flavobacteriaceae bacterium]|nr:XdhC family protein [Flavobacteriaceae bacterium]